MPARPLLRLAIAACLAAPPGRAHAAEATPTGDLAALAAPGFERVLLAGGRLLRARVRTREGGQALLEREDGLLLLAPDAAIERVLAPEERFPRAGGDAASIYLRDGRVVRGWMVLRTPDGGAVVERLDGGLEQVGDVRLVRDGGDAPRALSRSPIVPAPQGVTARVRLTTRAGRVLEGTLLGRSEDALLADLEGLGRVAVLADAVAGLDVEPGAELPAPVRAEAWLDDQTAHRALALPTALLRERGGTVLDQTGLVTSVAAFPLRHLQLAVGTAWPAWYQAGAGWNALATLKGGLSLGKRVHLAAGAHGFLADAGSAAFAFAAATCGTPDANVSLYVGPPLAGSADAGRFGDRVLAASATWRFAPRFAVLTEHWIGADGGPSQYAGALGVRHVRRRLAIDVALMHTPEANVLGWVGFGWALSLPAEGKP